MFFPNYCPACALSYRLAAEQCQRVVTCPCSAPSILLKYKYTSIIMQYHSQSESTHYAEKCVSIVIVIVCYDSILAERICLCLKT